MPEDRMITRVICCGNPFRGDDGAGIEVFNHLEKEQFPSHVEVIEGGILGLNLLPLFQGCSTLILVDSILMDKPPGSLQWFTMSDVLKSPVARISSHEMTPAQLMTVWYRLNGDAADMLTIFLLGIVISEPGCLSNELSPCIKKGALAAALEIKHEIRSVVTHEKY